MIPLRSKKIRFSSALLSFRRSVQSSSDPLLSDPFHDHKKMVRGSNKQFPKPHFISFDVFGTLYTPKAPIAQQYHVVAMEEFGINKSLESIEKEFPKIYSEIYERYPNYGKRSSDIKNCDEWWSEIIVKLFDLPHYTKDETSAKLCRRLLTYFTGREAYMVYDDVIPTLTKLKENNINLVVSSNSDLRVMEILKNLGLMDFFAKDHIYLSYDLDASKPDKKFFDSVYQRFLASTLETPSDVSKQLYLENCWHIGDSEDKDFLGPVRSGWNAVLLDRENTSQFLIHSHSPQKPITKSLFAEHSDEGINSPELKVIANNRVVLRNLDQLLAIFGLHD
ncbi:DEHA2G08624p [Debaryomyces hansenii CBS767]|uniref:DEHA2G08624p n=1 Tax=Debaryomyces hansenii (strain ATCC 36239 / CBS 767 / BCRC 21394 / JCM 1990 / NBRC 0083 / IGC 2968) TaxID=284592 RepID=Q6BIP9_DEBHA|nr:DEHA2G08624p [Debaryomyces hansenii CBS767]CAG90385.2 DEHA2G08624p [Debaryomyces hansenii CBS767]|eukprot:XP_461922.2 DEHA2G08624p [Debaryomyces hansenii CBS767]